MKEAIKVKLKFDTAGVGHERGKEFTTRWWEEQYNSSAARLNGEAPEEEVQ